MRIPLAKDGTGVIVVGGVVLSALGWGLSLVVWWGWIPALVLWFGVAAFFRDPERRIHHQPHILYSPADGRITEVTDLDHHPVIGEPGVRIRIFLSLFDVHINRSPCAAEVKTIEHKPGRYMNAMKRESAEVNESNTLVLHPAAPWRGPIVLRQISGMIARTIVCHARPGNTLAGGQRFGMIKFGSGTELAIPRQNGLTVLVGPGSVVYAGLTEIARLDTMKP